MARNESGLYSLPAGSIVADGDDFLASQHNTPLNDLAADANIARPVVSGGTGATDAETARTNLGLLPVQSSVTDTTSGRLMRTGGFGIGIPMLATSFDAATGLGEYYAADGATGAPTSGTVFFNVRRINGGTTIVQTAYPAAGTTRIYLRKSIDSGATWLTWEQLAANVIVSNANGKATQDPVNRIMTSWHTITLIQASSTECNFTWVFPAQYSGSPKVFALGKLPLNASVSNQQLKAPTVANAITGTAALIRQHCTSGTFGPSDSLSVDVMAIGSY